MRKPVGHALRTIPATIGAATSITDKASSEASMKLSTSTATMGVGGVGKKADDGLKLSFRRLMGEGNSRL